MKIAVISDTHDNIPAVKEAFRRIQDLGIRQVLHLGDVIAPFVVRFLREVYDGRLLAVYGNNDGERLFLRDTFQKFNAEIRVQPVVLELHGRRIHMTHEPFAPEALAQTFDVVLYGHTHELRVEKPTQDHLILNPGEACGYLTGRRTFAVLDLERLEADIVEF